jgi:hypothetical protein
VGKKVSRETSRSKACPDGCLIEVQSKACRTCIYKKSTGFDTKVLEAQVADKYGGFKGYRICHHSKNACCRGFWNRHKDKFQLGQIAQRLGLVKFVDHDTIKGAK